MTFFSVFDLKNPRIFFFEFCPLFFEFPHCATVEPNTTTAEISSETSTPETTPGFTTKPDDSSPTTRRFTTTTRRFTTPHSSPTTINPDTSSPNPDEISTVPETSTTTVETSTSPAQLRTVLAYVGDDENDHQVYFNDISNGEMDTFKSLTFPRNASAQLPKLPYITYNYQKQAVELCGGYESGVDYHFYLNLDGSFRGEWNSTYDHRTYSAFLYRVVLSK